MLDRYFRSCSFQTLEELENSIHSPCSTFVQLSKSRKPGTAASLQGERLQLYHLSPSCDLIEVGHVPAGKLAISFNASAKHFFIQSRVLNHQHLTSFKEKDKYIAIHAKDSHSYLLFFDLVAENKQSYTSELSCLLRALITNHCGCIHAPEQVIYVDKTIQRFLTLNADEQNKISAVCLSQLETELLVCFGRLAHRLDCYSPFRLNRRARIVCSAIEYVTQCDLAKASTKDIAVAINISQRSLNAAFNATLEQTLTSYIRKFKLNYARKDLLCAPPNYSVEQCAYDYGFRHVGKFIRYYKDIFDETPGHTLKTSKCKGVGVSIK